MSYSLGLLILILATSSVLALTPGEISALESINSESFGLEHVSPPWNRSLTTACQEPVLYGLKCSNGPDPHITELVFNSQFVLSAIPDSIGELLWLTVLEMKGACVPHPLPSSLGNITGLRHLRLIGSIACAARPTKPTFPESMGDLSSLETLVIAAAMAGIVPESFSNFTRLQTVELGVDSDGWAGNPSLDGRLPDAWCSLANLRSFKLRYSRMDGFQTATRCTWPNMEHLDLTHSAFFRLHLPSLLTGSPHLKQLSLFGSREIFGTLDADMSTPWPQNLTILDSTAPLLNGTLSSSFWKLKHLESISFVSSASLAMEISNDVTKMRNLRRLELKGARKLFGTIPEEIGKLSNLTILTFSGAPSLHGTIPSSIVELKNLRNLHIEETSIEGTIPEKISDLRLLVDLVLSSNALNGTIPQQIGSLRSLYWLSLANNYLSGTIPESMGEISALDTLLLTSNQLRGTLPESLAGLLELKSMSLGENRLTGTIPNFRSEVLLALDLSNNKLEGTVPPIAAKQVLVLRLNQNLLGGAGYELPKDIFAQNTAMRMLDLSKNVFFNTSLPDLPPAEYALKADFRSNGFVGTIPSASYCGPRVSLTLSENRLSGSLDGILSPSCNIIALDISKNSFFGTIPSSISNMTSIKSLDISENQFYGPIPPLPFVKHIRFANNAFSGQLSQEFVHSVAFREPEAMEKSHFDKSYSSFLDSDDDETFPIKVVRRSKEIRVDDILKTFLSNPKREKTESNAKQGSLATIDLSGNQLECSEFPELLQQLLEAPSLAYLSLARNKLDCPLPPGLDAQMIGLDLSHNQFSGTLPYFYRDTLTSLKINDNRFTGDIRSAPFLTNLDVSNNRLTGTIVFDMMPNLVVFKAANNSLKYMTELVELRNLETLDVANNLLRDFAHLELLSQLVQFHALRFIDISQNSLLQTVPVDKMVRAGIVKTSLSSKSPNLNGVICAQLTFKGAQSLTIFNYDEDLFDYAQCECDSKHFGSPQSCIACPSLGSKFCGATSLETATNWFVFNNPKSNKKEDDVNIDTETCIVTPEQALTGKTNCKGIQLVSSMEATLNASFLEKKLPSQCTEGSDGRLCSRCTCNKTICHYNSGPICHKCSTVLSSAQSAGLVSAIVVVVIIALIALMFAVLKSKRTKPTKKRWNEISFFRRFCLRILHASSLGNVTILINFLQMMSALTHWDLYAFKGLLELLNGNGEGIGLRCLLPFLADPMSSLVSRLMLPFIVITLIAISIFSAQLILRQTEKRKKDKDALEENEASEDEGKSLIADFDDFGSIGGLGTNKTTIFYPTLALFTSVSISVFRFLYLGTTLTAHEYMFSHTQTHTGVKYLQKYPWMKWDDASALFGVSIPAILVFDLILPILFLLLCWKVRKTFYTLEVSIYFGNLFEMFSPKCFWWEIVNIAKKLGVALLLRGLPPTSTQSTLVITVLAAGLGAQVILSPWKRRSENIFDTVSAALLILSIHASHTTTISESPGITYFVAALNSIFALLCIAAILFDTLTEDTDYHRKLHFYSSVDRLQRLNQTIIPNSAPEEEIEHEENMSQASEASLIADPLEMDT